MIATVKPAIKSPAMFSFIEYFGSHRRTGIKFKIVFLTRNDLIFRASASDAKKLKVFNLFDNFSLSIYEWRCVDHILLRFQFQFALRHFDSLNIGWMMIDYQRDLRPCPSFSLKNIFLINFHFKCFVTNFSSICDFIASTFP